MKKLMISALASASLALAPAGVLAATSSSGSCADDNAVVCGGVGSTSAMSGAYQGDVRDVYTCFGISSSDMDSFASDAVSGRVTRAGNVIVNGKVVATEAMTAGRQDISGSTRISCGGHIFYKRPPSVSFEQSSLPAYVVMRGGQFAYAVIQSCGNPVMATPVVQPKPKVKNAVTVVQPAPPAPTQTQTQTVYVAQPAPAPAPVPAPAPTPPPVTTNTTTVVTKALPNTGPGNVLGLAGISTVLGTAGHLIYNRRRWNS